MCLPENWARKRMMEPIGAPKIVKFALCNMFSACTHPYVKDKVLKSFSDPNGILRIEVTMIVFGMGLHCLNVCWIIQWGFPSDIKLYLQETGRAGCDGKEAVVCQLIIPLKAGACIMHDHDEWNIVAIRSVSTNFTKRLWWQQCEMESPGCQCCKLVLFSVYG